MENTNHRALMSVQYKCSVYKRLLLLQHAECVSQAVHVEA